MDGFAVVQNPEVAEPPWSEQMRRAAYDAEDLISCDKLYILIGIYVYLITTLDRAHTVPLARALRDRELGFEARIELGSRKFFPCARGNQILQPQVDAHVAAR